MARPIVTGSDTAAAMKGMIAHPSDREKATGARAKAAGASGAVSGLKTVQCFTSAEVTEAQKAAGAIAATCSAPG